MRIDTKRRAIIAAMAASIVAIAVFAFGDDDKWPAWVMVCAICFFCGAWQEMIRCDAQMRSFAKRIKDLCG